MTEIRFSLVGPGNVGRSLASWLTARGARLDRIASRDRRTAADLVALAGGEAIGLAELDSSEQDLLLLTVAEPALPEIARLLSERPQASVALHVSGSSDAEILAPLRGVGCRIGTLHPLRAFPHPSTDVADASGVVFTIDGDSEARTMANDLASSIGGVPIEIEPATRPLYHLAASLAAGGVVTLLAVVDEIVERLALPPEVTGGYIDLAHQALEMARPVERPAAALTGPVARGDREVVARQLTELERSAPELGEVVSAVLRETLRQRRRAGLATAERVERELLEILAPRREDSG